MQRGRRSPARRRRASRRRRTRATRARTSIASGPGEQRGGRDHLGGRGRGREHGDRVRPSIAPDGRSRDRSRGAARIPHGSSAGGWSALVARPPSRDEHGRSRGRARSRPSSRHRRARRRRRAGRRPGSRARRRPHRCAARAATRSAAWPLAMPPRSRRTPTGSVIVPVTGVHDDRVAARVRACRVAGARRVSRPLGERPVVARGLERVEHRRVEPSAGVAPRVDRRRDQLAGRGAHAHRPTGAGVEPAELRIGAEAAPPGFELVDARACAASRSASVPPTTTTCASVPIARQVAMCGASTSGGPGGRDRRCRCGRDRDRWGRRGRGRRARRAAVPSASARGVAATGAVVTGVDGGGGGAVGAGAVRRRGRRGHRRGRDHRGSRGRARHGHRGDRERRRCRQRRRWRGCVRPRPDGDATPFSRPRRAARPRGGAPAGSRPAVRVPSRSWSAGRGATGSTSRRAPTP